MGGTLPAQQRRLPGAVVVGQWPLEKNPSALADAVGGNLGNSGSGEVCPRTVESACRGQYLHACRCAGWGVYSRQHAECRRRPCCRAATCEVLGPPHRATCVRPAKNVLVTSAEGLSGTFATLSFGPGVLLEATLGYDPSKAWLDITPVVGVTAAAQGDGPDA